MFQRKVTIIFAIIGIATVLGFIVGVAPGYFLKSYALFGVGAGFVLFIFILLIITTLIYEYLNKKQIFSTRSIRTKIFHASLSSNEKILLIFTGSILFTGGILLGILCELLLKAISASLAAHLIIAAIFIIILLVVLVIILLIETKDSKSSKIEHSEQYPVMIEMNPRSQILTKPQDGPQNTASRINRYRSRHFDDDSKLNWQDSSFNGSMTHSTNTFNISKPPSNIQKEYQKLLHPSSRFFVDEKVYVNDNDIAQIIEVDGVGNYRIQYLDDGSTDFKNGTELRKALPFIN